MGCACTLTAMRSRHPGLWGTCTAFPAQGTPWASPKVTVDGAAQDKAPERPHGHRGSGSDSNCSVLTWMNNL